MGKTVNLATKYAEAAQERFYMDSLTQGSFSNDLDMAFTGVKTVEVYEVDTVPLGDYQRKGANRYGTPQELTDCVQEFVMGQDKAFTYTIDKGNAREQFNVKQAATSLKRQMREVVTPYIDRYRMRVWADNAGIVQPLGAAPTKSTIASDILDASARMDDALVPQEGRTLYVTAGVYKLLKLCDEFSRADALAAQAAGKGTVGEFDGMRVQKVPASYMPEGVYFMIVKQDAAISPVKLNDYKIHTDPPGISGDLVEGRVIFDAFVKGAKAKGVCVAVEKEKAVAAPEIVLAGDSATISCATEGASIRYTLDGSDPAYSTTAKPYAGAVSFGEDETEIRAFAKKEGMFRSETVEAARV